MKTNLLNIVICNILISLSLSGCGSSQLPESVRFVSIAAGALHTCVLTSNGEVKCWGSNDYGQLGDGTTITRTTLVDVKGLMSGVSAISAGDWHTCALTLSGYVKCWGNNGDGQLGDGTTTQRLTPVDVSGLTNRVSAIASGSSYTCALTLAGGVKCWGWKNTYAEGNDNSATTKRLVPVDVTGLTNGIIAISSSTAHTCILTSSSGAKCWGSNDEGQLGDGTTINRATPVDVSGLTSGVRVITAKGYCTCALTLKGGVKCWGINFAGQLGDGTTIDHTAPVDVSGLANGVTAITLSGTHTCALTSNGAVKCWGDNSQGQLGDGTINQQLTPVNVSGLPSDVSAIVAGSLHTCALTLDGVIKCWGANFAGQLGDGTTDQRLTPADVIK